MDDKKEKMVPSAEEREKEDSLQKEEEEVEEDDDEEGEVDADVEEQDGRGENEKEGEPADKTEERVKLSVQAKEKKSSDGLNLNNEVVRMRKEVKRVRALIIRKLTRQCGALKKKKGKEAEIEKNQRRAARILEEIHALKALSPDLVTKRALQKDLNFEQVCKNPKSTISDRAISRIATHPQFKKKIDDIKAAVKSFKEERMKGGGQTVKEKVQNKAGKIIPQLPAKKEDEKTEEVEDVPGVKKKLTNNKGGSGICKDNTNATSTEPGIKTMKATNSTNKVGQIEKMSEPKNVNPAICKKGKDTVKRKLETVKSESKGLQIKKDVEESDLESSDEEDKKEYFDDSTEERFHKQSSHSEESESDNDFFVGKINKFRKKKKKQKSAEGEKTQEVKMVAKGNVERKLDEVESRQKLKATSLQSVFCSSLAASHPGSDRERGGDKFRGRGKPRSGSGQRDYSKQSKFIKQEKGTEITKSELPDKGFHPISRGGGRGRGDVLRQKDHLGGRVMASKQALHPSWEASKKRKEQQGQILAFQGKKIKFVDDE
ncbi:serum response factor-binding protein 1 [Antennarius striatus]|uniref:serum response factor-binding protein 1 n=1 Tax=Antennarius striatus TaxID=241820 RepID=UPI0035B49A9C